MRKLMWALCLLLSLTSVFAGEGLKRNQDNSERNSVEAKFKKVQSELEHASQGGKWVGQASSRRSMAQSGNSGKSLAFTAIQMVFSLALIIVLVVISIRLLKKFQKAPLIRGGGNKDSMIQVWETCYLGNDQKVVILNIGGQPTVIGVTPQGISYLKDLPDNISAPSGRNKSGDDTGKTNRSDFSDSLNHFLGRFRTPKTVAQTMKEM